MMDTREMLEGAAQQRRLRRLRSWWRHEQQTLSTTATATTRTTTTCPGASPASLALAGSFSMAARDDGWQCRLSPTPQGATPAHFFVMSGWQSREGPSRKFAPPRPTEPEDGQGQGEEGTG